MRQAMLEVCLLPPPPITPDWIDNSGAQGAAALATRQVFNFEASAGAVRLSQSVLADDYDQVGGGLRTVCFWLGIGRS